VTFFRVKTLVDSVIVHAAVTDLDGQQFSFTGMVLPLYVRFARDTRVVLGFFGNRLALDKASNSLLIDTQLRGLQISIACHVHGVMAQGSNGVLPMQNSPGDESYYFTMPDMTTDGTIVLKGESLHVSGLTWHDHQWGSFNLVGLKWDWFSLRFDADDLYVMLFNFDRWGTTYGEGNLCSAGMTRRIGRCEVSPADVCRTRTGISYPVDWEVRLFDRVDALSPFMVAHVRPVLNDQSVSSLVTPDYWEGLCVVRAQIVAPIDLGGRTTLEPKTLDGFAYVELTGYER
jgi:predicted secreted hydrolase